jgi:regulatory protein
LARALDELQAKGFISEQRVIESVVHRRAAAGGRRASARSCKGKGAGPDKVCSRRLRCCKATELASAGVWRKKFHEPASDATSRAKQMRFLASRGFGAEAIQPGRHWSG